MSTLLTSTIRSTLLPECLMPFRFCRLCVRGQSNTVDFVDFQQSRPCWIQLCWLPVCTGLYRSTMSVIRGSSPYSMLWALLHISLPSPCTLRPGDAPFDSKGASPGRRVQGDGSEMCSSTVGDRAFHAAAARTWNSLPPDVTLLRASVTSRWCVMDLPAHLRSPLISRGQFRAGLKTHLFKQAYSL